MGGSPKLAPNSIIMVLVDLDVHQIVGYHYYDHHQPSRVQSTLQMKILMLQFLQGGEKMEWVEDVPHNIPSRIVQCFEEEKVLAKRVIFFFYRNTLQFLHIYTPHKIPNPPNYLDSKHKQQSPLWPQTEMITRAFLTCHCFQNTYSQFISLDQVLFSIGWEYF